jgi:hypothetical protein
MGTWGPGIFSDDEAADARDDWRTAVIADDDLEAATDRILRHVQDAAPGPDQDPYAANPVDRARRCAVRDRPAARPAAGAEGDPAKAQLRRAAPRGRCHPGRPRRCRGARPCRRALRRRGQRAAGRVAPRDVAAWAHSIRARFAEHLPADDRAEFERLVERPRTGRGDRLAAIEPAWRFSVSMRQKSARTPVGRPRPGSCDPGGTPGRAGRGDPLGPCGRPETRAGAATRPSRAPSRGGGRRRRRPRRRACGRARRRRRRGRAA